MNELCTKGAVELARMIRSRQTTSTEVVEAYLARIEEVNSIVNAVTVVLADEARAAAATVDQSLAAGTPLGPVAGVPFTVKENIDVAGSATTWGVTALKNQIAATDAPMVARPSQMCGTAALRPTLGRIADAAVTEPSASTGKCALVSTGAPTGRLRPDMRSSTLSPHRLPRPPRHGSTS